MVKFIPNKNFYKSLAGGGSIINYNLARESVTSTGPNFDSLRYLMQSDFTYTGTLSNASNLYLLAANIVDANNPSNSELYITNGFNIIIKSVQKYKEDNQYLTTGLKIIGQVDNSAGANDKNSFNSIKLQHYYYNNSKPLSYVYGLIVLDEPVIVKAGETYNFTILLKDLAPDIPLTLTD